MNNTKTNSRYGYRPLGKEVYISNDTRVTHLNNNDLIIGGSGNGKTGCLVYPQLKALKDSSMVVVDTKNSLCKMFSDELREKGYDVKAIDFVNPEKSCKYNPLDYIRKNLDGSYNELDISKLCFALIPNTLDSKELIWTISARMYLEFFVTFCLEALPKKDHHMNSVIRLYRSYTSELGEGAFIPWLEAHPSSLAKSRYDMIQSQKVADRMHASILGFVNAAVAPFEVSQLKYIYNPGYPKKFIINTEYPKPYKAKTQRIDLAQLGKRKTVLFLNISDTDHSMDILVNLLYTQLMQTLVSEADKNEDGRLDVPVRIIMDDFAGGTTIPDFDKLISVVRSRDIWLTLCIQSLSQLETLYSYGQAQTIINNCDHIVYLGSNDAQSAEFIGIRANKTPETILCMDRTKKEYIIEGGKPAILTDKFLPYQYQVEKIVEMQIQ